MSLSKTLIDKFAKEIRGSWHLSGNSSHPAFTIYPDGSHRHNSPVFDTQFIVNCLNHKEYIYYPKNR